jgi:phage shock protein C
MVRAPPSRHADGMRYDTDSPSTPVPPRRFIRSRDDRMIAGVCGGLAQYFGIDPTIVRVGAVALALAGGAGVPAYLAAWLFAPAAEPSAARHRSTPGAPAAPVRVINLVDQPAGRAPMAPARG